MTNFCFKILGAVKEVIGWLEKNAVIGTIEDFEEQREILSSITDPITSRVYAEAGAYSSEDYQEAVFHDEL